MPEGQDDLIRLPESIDLGALAANGWSLSPSSYRTVTLETSETQPLRSLLSATQPFEKGQEPGSSWYLKASPKKFIRTKALQEFSNLLYPKGNSIIPVNPRVFRDYHLADEDILLAKDSNIGECAILFGEDWRHHMFSGGIVRIRPTIDPYYLFAFLKHPMFKAQLDVRVSRGATLRHAKDKWLDCLIPVPKGSKGERRQRQVATLMRLIVEKEALIRRRDTDILKAVDKELRKGEAERPFLFSWPTLAEVERRGRLDAAIYDKKYQELRHLIDGYAHGYDTPSDMGFTVYPGPSLEMKILRTRVDSDTPRPGFYALLLPKNISEYGTINRLPYLGTGKHLPLLQLGDVLVGEAGFHKGRSLVLLSEIDRCTTNAHGLYVRHEQQDIDLAVFFRCVFHWYRHTGLLDAMAVGGSGGHLSPSYFDDYLHIPRFPAGIRRETVMLYHTADESLPESPEGETSIEWHRERNKRLGIWNLASDIRVLTDRLREVQAEILGLS